MIRFRSHFSAAKIEEKLIKTSGGLAGGFERFNPAPRAPDQFVKQD